MDEIIKGEIPFVRILLPLVAGICAALLFSYPDSLFLVQIALAATAVSLASLLFGYKYFNIYKRRWLPGILFHLFVFLLSYCLTIDKSQKADKRDFSDKNYDGLVAKITSEPKLSADILRFETEVEQGF